MDTNLHTFISVLSLFFAYCLGRYLERKSIGTKKVIYVISRLEKDGYLNKKGKELFNSLKVEETL